MPETIGTLPYFEVQFTKDGKRFDDAAEQALIDGLGGVTDLFVVSHGWNNDMEEARALYRELFGNVNQQMHEPATAPKLTGRQFAVLGVLWPSKKFADEELIAGGGAASTGGDSSAADAHIAKLLDDLADLLDPPGAPSEAASPDARSALQAAKSLIPDLDDDPEKQDAFTRIVRAFFPQDATLEDQIPPDFFTKSGDELLPRLGRSARPRRSAVQGATALSSDDTERPLAGGAAGLGDKLGKVFTQVKAGARNLLNFVTYYQMKNRAGVVGQRGVSPLLRRVKAAFPNLKLHLVGHSFGGRLVTATALGDAAAPVQFETMTLLQAAFSHFGFADNYEGTKDGFFRDVVTGKRVKGPVIITYTENDQAVGLAYPIASRIGRQIASEIGDASDPYGGIGRNGAQKTPEAESLTMLDLDGSYSFKPGRLHNLRADKFIANHGDVRNPAVAHALLSAVATA